MKSGANGNFVAPSVNHSALHWLAYYGDYKAIKVYLENNDYIELEDYVKNYREDGNDVQKYCEKYGPLNAFVTSNGQTPADIAGDKQNYRSLRVMMDHFFKLENKA